MVSGRFRFITFFVHFISNLMPPQIWQEVRVHGLEVGDPRLLLSFFLFFLNQKTASFASELNLVWFYWHEQQRADDPSLGTDLREGR